MYDDPDLAFSLSVIGFVTFSSPYHISNAYGQFCSLLDFTTRHILAPHELPDVLLIRLVCTLQPSYQHTDFTAEKTHFYKNRSIFSPFHGMCCQLTMGLTQWVGRCLALFGVGGWVKTQLPASGGQSNPTGLHRTSVPSQQNSLQILIPVQVSLLTSAD